MCRVTLLIILESVDGGARSDENTPLIPDTCARSEDNVRLVEIGALELSCPYRLGEAVGSYFDTISMDDLNGGVANLTDGKPATGRPARLRDELEEQQDSPCLSWFPIVLLRLVDGPWKQVIEKSCDSVPRILRLHPPLYAPNPRSDLSG